MAIKDNADVVEKFIFRYLDLPLTNGSGNILVKITDKDIPNKFIELNKFLNNVCIIRVNLSEIDMFVRERDYLHQKSIVF